MASGFDPSDAAWSLLLDDKALAKRREASERKYRDLSGDQLKGLRKRAKTDLFFLSHVVLEYDLLSVAFHGAYFQWLKAMWGERYRMTLHPRDHYKSTGNTISDSIQMALPNDAGVTAHPYCLGPDIKLLLAHENRESASRFLFEITQAFRAKSLMLALFPDCIPSSRQQRMNKWELELPRSQHHKEPTFDTIGAAGAAQGRHYNWLKLDDLVGEDARDSDVVMKRVLLWFDNANSLLTRLKLDGWDLTGTRWAYTDVYSHAVRMYGVNKERSVLNCFDPVDISKMEEGQLVIHGRKAIERGVPVFPEEFTLEDLARIRRNPVVWAAQYANNPKEAGLTKLRPEWLKFYNLGARDRLVVFEGDSSRVVKVGDLDRVILCDPAVGDDTANDEWGIVVTGTDKDLNIYVLEVVKRRMLAPQGLDELLRLIVKWNPRLTSIEAVAFSANLAPWLREKAQQLGLFPAIYDYKPGNKVAKRARIEGLGHYASAGQLYILEGMHELRDEWDWFGVSQSEHLLDALAQGQEVWIPGQKNEEIQEVGRAVDRLMEERSSLTGY